MCNTAQLPASYRERERESAKPINKLNLVVKEQEQEQEKDEGEEVVVGEVLI